MFIILRHRIRVRFLLIRLFFNPKVKKRYLEQQRQMKLNRIRIKAARNWNNQQGNFRNSGLFIQVGDRLVLMHQPEKDTLGDIELHDTLNYIEVDDLELDDETNSMLSIFNESRANRKSELFQFTDTVSDEVNPWAKYHKIA